MSKVHPKNTRHISVLNYKQLSSWTGICPLGKQNIVAKSHNASIANMYLLKVKNRGTRKKCIICSKLTIKTPERCH